MQDSASHLSTTDIAGAVRSLLPYMVETLSGFVAAASPSGQEQPAAEFIEAALRDLGLASERIELRADAIRHLPLFSPPCCPDGGRYNLLATHRPAAKGGRSVLFNGHLDVVPTGPESMWRNPPYTPVVEDGWLYGRGSGDMKAGIVCALAAFKALRALGVQPAGAVGFNAVLEEENTGNGALATVAALRSAVGAGKLAAFDTVIIPEPLGEGLMSAQVGVYWMFIELTGKPAHAAYMTSGVNPVEAGVAVMEDLRELEAEWNRPENRPPVYRDHAHPINFNLGRSTAANGIRRCRAPARWACASASIRIWTSTRPRPSSKRASAPPLRGLPAISNLPSATRAFMRPAASSISTCRACRRWPTPIARFTASRSSARPPPRPPMRAISA